MSLLKKPFNHYLREVRLGIWLILIIGVIRFFLKPVFGISYEQATWVTSLTLLVLLLLVAYSIRAAVRGETYRDVLGISAALSFTSAAFLVVAIAIDEFGGIDTFYTDMQHGGELNPFLHMGGHMLGAVIGSLFGWGLGSLVLMLTRFLTKTRAASM